MMRLTWLFPEGLQLPPPPPDTFCRYRRGLIADGNGTLFSTDVDIFASGPAFSAFTGLALGGDAQHIPGQLADLAPLCRMRTMSNDIADVLLVPCASPREDRVSMACDRFGGVASRSLRPRRLIRSSPSRLVTVTLRVPFPCRLDVLVKGAENIDCLLHPLNADPLFHAITPKVIRTRRPVHLLYK